MLLFSSYEWKILEWCAISRIDNKMSVKRQRARLSLHGDIRLLAFLTSFFKAIGWRKSLNSKKYVYPNSPNKGVPRQELIHETGCR